MCLLALCFVQCVVREEIRHFPSWQTTEHRKQKPVLNNSADCQASSDETHVYDCTKEVWMIILPFASYRVLWSLQDEKGFWKRAKHGHCSEAGGNCIGRADVMHVSLVQCLDGGCSWKWRRSVWTGLGGRWCAAHDAAWHLPQRCFRATNSRSVFCQPVGHLGGVNPDTLRRDSTSSPPPTAPPLFSSQCRAKQKPQNAPGAVTADEEWCWRKIPLSLRCNERSGARYHWENYSPRCLPWHQQRADLGGASENETRGKNRWRAGERLESSGR